MIADPLAIESLLAFWASAGADVCFTDAPQDRLRPLPVPAPPASASPARASVAVRATPSVTPDAARREPATPSVSSFPPMEQESDAREDIAALVAQASAAAAACEDLDSLSAAISAFEGCPLKAGARQAVFSRGVAGAPVFAIGEAPGAEEDQRGQPFVGRAGQLLDRMLAAAGLTDRVFISNTVFWRPPGNREPTADEQAVCAPFLRRAIALNQPKVLLLLGGCAAKSVLSRREGILSLRGRWFEWRGLDDGAEIPALPTLHPAFLLRQPAAKKKAWEDLLLLRERLDRPQRGG